jgi:hypothetical protein
MVKLNIHFHKCSILKRYFLKILLILIKIRQETQLYYKILQMILGIKIIKLKI